MGYVYSHKEGGQEERTLTEEGKKWSDLSIAGEKTGKKKVLAMDMEREAESNH